MSAMTAEIVHTEAVNAGAISAAAGAAPTSRRTAAPTQPRRRPTRRPAHGTGRASAPVARPVRAVPAPTLAPGARTRARSCTVEAAPARWRLTDRGIAVVLVTGLMIVAAAVAVVGMTALRVTGENYQPFQQSEAVGSTQG